MGRHGATRREMLKIVGAAGAGAAVLTRALAALAADAARITPARIREAGFMAGLDFTREEADLMAKGLADLQTDLAKLRAVPLDNAVPPALLFDPEPGEGRGTFHRRQPVTGRGAVTLTEREAAARSGGDEDLAFLPVSELAPLLRTRQVSSVELTRLYLERMHRLDPTLHAVITFTEDLALRQAEKADREIGAGRYRGPLHGIPWGAKDLLAVPGYPTTWGAVPYREQVRPEKATVVARLEDAGAALLAKLAVGELAWGDVWFGAMTRNPWNTEQGSSGSSAGSAAAVAAGLAGFTIGTETWGSIVSPCTRCGATGLRPTFGRVSRHGAMALAWSMDKIGPITRGVEDCAVVFGAIHGADGLDPSAVERPFDWPMRGDPRTLRIGFVEALFDEDRSGQAEKPEEKAELAEWKEIDRRTLATLRQIGFELAPIELPSTYPVAASSLILTAEAATAFDALTRSGQDDLMVRQIADAWPTVFRLGQLVPAVDYLRACRVRTLVMRETERALDDVDVWVAPSFGGDNLLRTNLTGHPCVVLPNGFLSGSGAPTSITFLGRLYGETELLAVAHAYQQATEFHLKRPPLATATPGKSRGLARPEETHA